MSKQHPYPDHVRDAVADAIESLFMEADTWEKIDAAHDNLADTALQALWEASRIDSVEDAKKLPAGTKLINGKGIFVAEAVRHYDFYAEEFPAHVIYWGDSDE